MISQYLEMHRSTVQQLAYRGWHWVNRREELLTGGGRGGWEMVELKDRHVYISGNLFCIFQETRFFLIESWNVRGHTLFTFPSFSFLPGMHMWCLEVQLPSCDGETAQQEGTRRSPQWVVQPSYQAQSTYRHLFVIWNTQPQCFNGNYLLNQQPSFKKSNLIKIICSSGFFFFLIQISVLLY